MVTVCGLMVNSDYHTGSRVVAFVQIWEDLRLVAIEKIYTESLYTELSTYKSTIKYKYRSFQYSLMLSSWSITLHVRNMDGWKIKSSEEFSSRWIHQSAGMKSLQLLSSFPSDNLHSFLFHFRIYILYFVLTEDILVQFCFSLLGTEA